MYFHYFCPLRKDQGPSFEQKFPFTQECFVPSLVEVGPVVLRKKIFKCSNVFLLFHNYLLVLEKKSLPTDRRTDRQTADDRWSEKLTWAFSSGELKTLVCISLLWGGIFKIYFYTFDHDVNTLFKHYKSPIY